MYPYGCKLEDITVSLRILDAPKFYDTKFWAPTFKILAKTMGYIINPFMLGDLRLSNIRTYDTLENNLETEHKVTIHLNHRQGLSQDLETGCLK